MGGMKVIATAQDQVKPQVANPQKPKEESFKMAEFVESNQYSPAKIELIRRTVAKSCDDLELAYFLSIAKGVGLNPLVKEIWCYKDTKDNLYIFAGRDGFHRLLHECKDFVSMNSCEVREGDKFKRGTKNGEDYIEHVFGELSDSTDAKKDRSKKRILGAYCIITVRRNGVLSKIVEWADFDRYNKKWLVWGTHPEEMIKKVVEIHAAKKVTNISGIYSEAEFGMREDEKTGDMIVETGAVEAGKSKKEILRKLQAQQKISKSKFKKKK